ncbi:uncharacterized protein EI90DRAFT_3125564 [Cantharellus anzutake]|uniref:uncharacterized protein n=1 Tax=Cantharellus anzutake TaxID=1750568 RepID=UPI001906C496|nr:uncharacterized protein EI90DRAFT_3125564 [Cantharellus anzutake]KAF8328810.1 hypothetical protein EI90DRAFT_3125564 [Cantharellus anzutake]
MPSARPFDEALARKSRAEDIKGPFKVEDFVDRHLSQMVTQNLPNFDAIRTAIQGLSGNVAAKRLTEVLNGISDSVGTYLPEVPPGDRIRFFVHEHGAVTHHPWAALNVSERPDILGTFQPIFDDYRLQDSNRSRTGNYIRFSYSQVETCIEVVSEGTAEEKGLKQAALYATSIHHVRLDKPCVYGLYAGKTHYYVIWSDPVAAYRSPRQSYSKPQALIKYVASLYNAPPSHIMSSPNATRAGFLLLSDNTIDTENLTPRSSACSPLWSIDDLDGLYRCIFSGIPHTRCTRVYAQVDPPVAQGAPIIYKQVMGRPDGGDPVHHEMEMLNHIHRDGYVRGVVRGVEVHGEPITIDVSFWDSDELNQWNADETHEQVTSRRSSAMFYLDTGAPISKGRTVLDLLAGFFDIVEELRYIVERREVVHRDISPSNIYIYVKSVTPQDPAALPENMLNPSTDQPTFINKYLDPDNRNQPRGLLGDLHLAARYLPDDNQAAEILRRFSGTPLYSPRAILSRSWAPEAHIFLPMPELQGEALHTYHMLFGPRSYEAGWENYDANNIHRLDSLQDPPLYRPRHDIESLFWVIVDTLLHVKPEGSEDSPSMHFATFEGILKGRRYRAADTSASLFFFPLSWWKSALHPALGPVLGELLHNMGVQVGPEYEYLIEPPRDTNLHEVLRRLLLQAIVTLNQQPPITLDSSRRAVRLSPYGPSVSVSLANSGSSA